jgi:MbtH protein
VSNKEQSVEESERQFLVLFNLDGQYSIWPAHLIVPAGWNSTGFMGTKPACLDHIAAIWTDMRPLSLKFSTSDT